jgi:hypothetical protein
MTNANGRPSQIQIFKRGGAYRVRPASQAAGKGTGVIFFNATGTMVRLFFPDAIFEGANPVDIRADTSEELTVNREQPLGVYPYVVYVVADREFAAGESAPVIIIDR